MSDRGARRREAAAELAHEVEALRQSWREAAKSHHLRVEGQFHEVLKALGGRPGGAASSLPRLHDAHDLRRAVHDLSLKPKRGRAKDLRTVERTVERLLRELAPRA